MIGQPLNVETIWGVSFHLHTSVLPKLAAFVHCRTDPLYCAVIFIRQETVRYVPGNVQYHAITT